MGPFPAAITISHLAQQVKSTPAMQETQKIPSLGGFPGERNGNLKPAPVFLPRESHGQRSLVGYSPWGPKEWDMTEHARAHASTHTHTHTHTNLYHIPGKTFKQWLLLFNSFCLLKLIDYLIPKSLPKLYITLKEIIESNSHV